MPRYNQEIPPATIVAENNPGVGKTKDAEDTTKSKDETKESTTDDERVTFHCKLCGLHERVHYFGRDPPFVYGLEFCEATYIMRDPFQPPIPKWKSKPEYFIAIGAHCIRCNEMVCKDTTCSFYFKNTYCLTCTKILANTFPMDIQVKLKKQLAMVH
ncbi:cysteine-rich DPF motif domain-containing protein 1-like [Musca domestica]|uniref:Cysteine-rich DPF motif domain-containing protein 1 n=1 Tax=Musca domestica TaxID=7370 RepID=A0A1I8MNU4_MUSDO|nr:cysteine-rich DPF motif domain-containing protein 1-like [Musca domestica]